MTTIKMIVISRHLIHSVKMSSLNIFTGSNSKHSRSSHILEVLNEDYDVFGIIIYIFSVFSLSVHCWFWHLSLYSFLQKLLLIKKLQNWNMSSGLGLESLVDRMEILDNLFLLHLTLLILMHECKMCHKFTS